MKIYNFLFITLIGICLSSCEKYLDVKTNNQQLLIKTAQDCQGILDNYSVMNSAYPSDGEASAGDYYLDDNAYLSSSLTQEDRGIYTWNASVLRPDASTQWKPNYYRIYCSNLVLEAAAKLENTDQTTINGLKGAALFFRAFSLWQVAQLYAKPYSTATSGQDPGIPIRLTSDVSETSVRGTVQQTYERILQDLKDASSLLPVSSQIASRPNKVAVLAMLARVYLSMEDYANAQENANAALQLKSDLIDFNTLSTTSTAPFTPRFNKEVIFQALTSNSLLLAGLSGGTSFAKIDLTLFGSYTNNDLRKAVFFKPVSNAPGTWFFTGNYEPGTGGTLFSGLAVDELYLIRAECYARSGNTAAAMTDLNTLLRSRWRTSTYVDLTAINADDALTQVVSERRKELLMRAQRWTDLRRLNKDSRFALTLSRTAQGVTYTLPPNDSRYTLLIPQEVIINSNMTQNTR